MIADDGKPGKSLKETSTEELKATLAKLKPTDPGAEGRIKAIKGELASRGGGDMEKAQPSESTSLTPEKARLMLHEGSGGHGRPITEQQRKFFGAMGGHLPAPGGKAKKSMDYEDLDDFLEKGGRGGTGVGQKTKGGYTVKMVGGKKRYVKEKEEAPSAPAPTEAKTHQEVFSEIQNIMKTDPAVGQAMGEMAGQMRSALGQGATPEDFKAVQTWIANAGSMLASAISQGKTDKSTIHMISTNSTPKHDFSQDVGYRVHTQIGGQVGKFVRTAFNAYQEKHGGEKLEPEKHDWGKPPTEKSMGDVMSLEDYMEKAGPYIGKRGGKWADPEHKIPWKEGGKGEGGEKPSGGKVKKLNAKQANALRAAAKFGVVPGGRDATFSMVNKLADAGLLESSKENPQVYRPTEAGKQALASGSYKPAAKTKGGEAPKSGEGQDAPVGGGGVKIVEGMVGKTVKPAGASGPGIKVTKEMVGKTVRPASSAGQGRSLGGGVEARVRQGASGKWSGTIIGKTGKTLPGATGDTAEEALDRTEKMFRQSGGGAKGGEEKKPEGEAPKGGGGGGLPEPKVSKIGNATIRDYGDLGLIRTLGKRHTVLDAEGTEVGELGEHKTLESAQKKLMSMKKSMGGVMSLEDWMEKSGGLPTHQQGMGHPKSSAVEGGSADGGELADVGRTSGSSDSAAGPGQDSQGQLKGVSPEGKEKLSADDEEDEKQMKPHKKPIETIKKSAFPADQRDSVAHEQAAAVSRLHKSEDVYVGPDRHPYSEHATHASGDLAASELVKSEGFYHGKSPQYAPSRPIIEQGVLCKSVNQTGCGETYSAALTSCPSCGAGTVGHRHLPGGPTVGSEMTILEKSIGPGSLLRRPTQEPDVKIG